jgi:hypothetical protein
MPILIKCFTCNEQVGCIIGNDVLLCETCEEETCPHSEVEIPNFVHCGGASC